MPRWWHDDTGRTWLDRLPGVVAERCARWDLEVDGPVLHGSNALVVPVRRGEQAAVLRMAPPGDDVAAEAAALGHWRAGPVVGLFEVDIGAGASLLERLDADQSLASEPILVAIGTLGALTRELAIPAPAWARTTADIAAEEGQSFVGRWQRLGGPTPRNHLDAALAAGAVLAVRDIAAHSSVNGDLHFEQVLAGGRHPWTVVDPVLLRGDPEYDLGRVLWSRLDELTRDGDVQQAFSMFVAAADVPAGRAQAWVLVRSMSYLLWGLERGLTLDPPKCRRLLELFS
ncbi:aminoglycoside phosphotransferase family protein [Nakamurella sp. A5-74]|uniref:Aminoglycoside phosphotransferase family protein n=1 Tax=Nakamurella sp. A5-74 TaxID=3158264 RepID=A0AAU8DY47_9ACTN